MTYLNILAIALSIGSGRGGDLRTVFPNGYVVDIVAVSSGNRGEVLAWSPDGRPVRADLAARIRLFQKQIKDDPVDSKVLKSYSGLWLELTPTTGPESQGVWVTQQRVSVLLDGVGTSSNSEMFLAPFEDYKKPFAFVEFDNLGRLKSPAVVSLGLASGHFKPRFTISHPTKFKSVHVDDSGTVGSNRTRIWLGSMSFTIPNKCADDDLWITAYDKKGVEIDPNWFDQTLVTLPPRSKKTEDVQVFSQVAFGQISKLVIEGRPLQWRKAKGVYLHPVAYSN